MAPRPVLSAAAETYRSSHGVSIAVESAGGVDVARRIDAGEAADIVVLSGDAIDKLIVAGRLAGDRRHDLMNSGIAVAVPGKNPVPDISDEAAVRRAVLDAPTIGYSTGPSGRYLESLFQRWGILENIRARIVVPPPGTSVASLLGSDRVALGFQQLSEMLGIPEIRVAGPLPAAIQHLTTFTGAIATTSLQPIEAEEFLRYLSAPACDGLKRQFGMTPA